MRYLYSVLCLLALTLPVCLQAQQSKALAIPRIEGPMKADGKLDEPFWQQAAITELSYEVSPGDNIPASVKTKAYMVDSGTSFRVAIEAFDPDPKKILAYLRNRDSAFQDDFAGFRVAAVIPEPSTLVLVALAGLGLICRRVR